MSINQEFFLDTAISRQAVRDALVDARIGLDAKADFEHLSRASSIATSVSIRDDEGVPNSIHLKNGVSPRCLVTFSDRKAYMKVPGFGHQYQTETVLGVMALLGAFPDADAYWIAYDAEIPVLLRRNGRLILGQRYWAEAARDLPLVDLPHVVEPLGPW